MAENRNIIGEFDIVIAIKNLFYILLIKKTSTFKDCLTVKFIKKNF